MIKTISSRLTAHFRPDGSHLDRYIARRLTITKSLCEDLILHDQVLIPTTDYLTAMGLVQIIGEVPMISLLEQQRIKFIRTRSVFGFVRGKQRDGGLLVLSDPNGKRPQDSPIEDSVAAAMTMHPGKFTEREKLFDLLVQNSFAEEAAKIIPQVTHETVQDFKSSKFWKDNYDFPTPNLVALPGVAKMQVRVVGAEFDPKREVVDAFLSLALYNTDVLLGQRYGCVSLSSFAPIGDLLDLKAARAGNRSEAAWELFEVNGVPDLSLADFTQPGAFGAFERLIAGKKTQDFRVWFHALKSHDRTEIMKEYISVLQDVPWLSRTPGKIFRFVTTTGLGMIPVVGTAIGTIAGVIDSFVLDQFFRPKSPKFFIDDLNKIAGVLRSPKPGKTMGDNRPASAGEISP